MSIEKIVKSLASKADGASESSQALEFSCAALNVANASAVLKESELEKNRALAKKIESTNNPMV